MIGWLVGMWAVAAAGEVAAGASGVVLELRGDAIVVTEVADLSPAAVAGLRAGDELRTIQGQPVVVCEPGCAVKVDALGLAALLAGDVGAELAVGVARQDAPIAWARSLGLADAIVEADAPDDGAVRVGAEPGQTLADLARALGVSKSRLLAVRDAGVSARTVWTRHGPKAVEGSAELPLEGEEACLAASLVSAAVFLERTPKASGSVQIACGEARALVEVEEALLRVTMGDVVREVRLAR